MTREEVIAAIRKAAEEMGEAPPLNELKRTGRVSPHVIRRYFGRYVEALEACGLERTGHGYKASLAALFHDWIQMVQRLKKAPSLLEYEAAGKFSTGPFVRRFGGWKHVAAGMMRYAVEQHMEADWKEELDIVAAHLADAPKQVRSAPWILSSISKPKLQPEEPIYGLPMVPMDLLLAPTNEQGVLFLFGATARKLGFGVVHLQTEFPDCRALREVEPGRCQMVSIELEWQSKNFLAHGHDPARVHLIVCWEHNWPECPVEVIELKSAVKRLAAEELRQEDRMIARGPVIG